MSRFGLILVLALASLALVSAQTTSSNVDPSKTCVYRVNFVANLLFSVTNLLLSVLDLLPGINIVQCPGSTASLIGPQCLLVSATEIANIGLVPNAVIALVGYLQSLLGVVLGTVTYTLVAGGCA